MIFDYVSNFTKNTYEKIRILISVSYCPVKYFCSQIVSKFFEQKVSWISLVHSLEQYAEHKTQCVP